MADKKECAITFGATNNYVFALANVLLGIKKYATPFWDDIIVLHTDITPENQQVINAILPCKFITVDDENWCEQLEKKLGTDALDMYSLATLFRYYCFDFLNKYHKIIWLDCDLLIQNDISGIKDYGEKTGYAACMADRMAPVEMCFKKLIPGYQMFVPLVNAGTLVLTDKLPHYESLCSWCKEKTVEFAEYLDMPDQGILNLLLQEFHIDVEPIDVTKYQCHPDYPKAMSPQSAFILHAYGVRKFWNDPTYQELFPEWQNFNQEYIHIAETITKKTCIDQGHPPLVSVIMSPYTRDEFLQEAVESILKQTYPYFELIVIVEYSEKQDDIVKKLESMQDKRIVVIRNEKQLGFANSLNIGLNAAKGKYIARMDDDDISYPERLEKQVEYMQLHPEIGILGTYAETFMNCHDIWNNYPTDPELAAIGLLRGTVLCHPTVIMRKSELQKYDLQYDPDAFTEDYDLWARAVKHLKISNLPEILYGYRSSGMNITVNQEVKVHRSHLNVMRMQFEKYLEMKPSEDELCLFNGRINTLGMVYTKNRGEADRVYDEFVHKIAKANKKTNFFNQEKLEIFLGLQKNGVVSRTEENKISLRWKVKKAIKRTLKPFVDRAVRIFGRNICYLINARADELNAKICESNAKICESNARMSQLSEKVDELGKDAIDIIKQINKLSIETARAANQFAQRQVSGRKLACIINDTFNSYHHGSSATSMAIEEQLKKHGFHVEKIHMIECRNMMQLDNSTVQNFESEEQFEKWKKENGYLHLIIEQSDCLVVNGEGCLSYFNENTLKLLYLIYISSTKMKKKVFVINTSILSENNYDNTNKGVLENIFCVALKNVFFCAVREKASMMLMQKILPGKAIQAFDSLPIYINEIYRPVDVAISEKYVVIAGGNFLPNWYPEFVKTVAKNICDRYSAKRMIVLSSDVDIPTKDQDVWIFDNIREMTIQCEMVMVKTTDEWLSYIQNASFVISGRFHHSIAAYMLNVPFAAFPTNNVKLSGALDMMECRQSLIQSTTCAQAVDEFLLKCNNNIFVPCKRTERILKFAYNNYSAFENESSI